MLYSSDMDESTLVHVIRIWEGDSFTLLFHILPLILRGNLVYPHTIFPLSIEGKFSVPPHYFSPQYQTTYMYVHAVPSDKWIPYPNDLVHATGDNDVVPGAIID